MRALNWSWLRRGSNIELMAEKEVLDFKPASRPKLAFGMLLAGELRLAFKDEARKQAKIPTQAID